MALNDNDLLLINDSQDSNEAKKIKYSTLKSNINGDDGNDLQAVTDNGNTTDNNIESAGFDNASDAGVGYKLFAAGQIESQRPKTGQPNQVQPVFRGYQGADDTSVINSDGSAEFSGFVESDLFSVSRSVVENKDNYFSKLAVNDTGKHFIANDAGGVTVASINADGSANFASSVTCQGYVDVTRENNSAAFQVNLTGTGATARIFGDGSAEFDSNVTVGPDPINGPYASLRASGALDLYANADDLFIFTGRKADGTPTTTIRGDGDAEFIGFVDCIRPAADDFGYLGIGPGGTDEKATFVNRGGDITLEMYENYSTTPTVTISGNGSANFTGAVQSDKSLEVYRPTAEDAFQSVIVGTKSGNTETVNGGWLGNGTLCVGSPGNLNAPAVINNDGSAQFAQSVATGGTGGATATNYGFIGFSNAPGPLNVTDGRETYATVYARNLDNTLAYVWKGADENANITSWIRNNGDCGFNGSANFAGQVAAGSTSLTGSHALAATNNGDDSQSSIVAVNVNGSKAPCLDIRNGTLASDSKAKIFNDGSASFATNVTVGGDPFGGNKVGSKLALGSCQATAATNSNDVWLGYVKGTPTATSKISGDGTANFNIEVRVENTPGANQYAVMNRGLINVSSSSNNVWEGRNAGVRTSRIGHDGTAHFAGNVTSDGTIGFTLPDGSTYDIRERIEEAISRVTAIETADLTDDQEHSALLTLIANMSSRITALEAQLAGGN